MRNTKKLTHQQFLKRLHESNPYYRGGEFRVVSNYTKYGDKVTLMDKYGETELTPRYLIRRGARPSIRAAVNPTEYWVARAKEVHGDKYDYSKVKYVGNKSKVAITCREHGIFKQSPDNHLKPTGCPLCSVADRFEVSVASRLSSYMTQSKEVHGDKYDYSKVEYVNGRDKVTITCKEHGDFKQSFESHSIGHGCLLCSREHNTHRFSDWLKCNPQNPAIFYILKCWNNYEEFHKLGITSQSSVKKRYPSKSSISYNYEVVRQVSSYNRRRIWELEKTHKKLLKDYHYTPIEPFGGSVTECFKI